MTYTNIFDSGHGSTIKVRRDDQYLIIRYESPVIPHPVFIYIPSDEADAFVKRLDRAVNAPAWSLAKFVRVKPHGYPSYTMVSTGENTWKSEHDTTHYTDSFLRMGNEIDFEVIA